MAVLILYFAPANKMNELKDFTFVVNIREIISESERGNASLNEKQNGRK